MARPKVEKKKLYVLPRFDKRRELSSGICNTIDLYGWDSEGKKFFLGSLKTSKLNANDMHCYGDSNKPEHNCRYTELEDQNLFFTIKNFLNFFDFSNFNAGYIFCKRNDHYCNEIADEYNSVYARYEEDVKQCVEEYNERIRVHFASFMPKLLELSSIYLMKYYNDTVDEHKNYNDIKSPKDQLLDNCCSYHLEQLEHITNAMSAHLGNILKDKSNYQIKTTNQSNYDYYCKSLDSIYRKYEEFNKHCNKKEVKNDKL